MLHRDIFWIGRQWCVTGFGIQLIDGKQEMRFDIPASNIWDRDLIGRLAPETWFDVEDFAHALKVAQTRAGESPKNFLPSSTNER